MSATTIRKALYDYLSANRTAVNGLARVTEVQRKDAYTTSNLPALVVGEPVLAGFEAWAGGYLDTYRVGLWLLVPAGVKPEAQEAARNQLHELGGAVASLLAPGGWGTAETWDALAQYDVGEAEPVSTNTLRLELQVEVRETRQALAPVPPDPEEPEDPEDPEDPPPGD